MRPKSPTTPSAPRHRRTCHALRPALEALEPRQLFTISVQFSTYNLLGSTPSDTLATNGWVGVLITAVSDSGPIGGFDLDSSNGGIFGNFTQQTNGTSSTATYTTPTASAGSAVDLSDSFFSNFPAGNFMTVVALAEDNNGSSHPATTLQRISGDYTYVPLADTSTINYGIGARLHGAGVFNLSTATSIPIAFVVVPAGSTVHVLGQFTDTGSPVHKFAVDQSFVAPVAPDTAAISTFFYNNSAYDGNNPAINSSDDNAIALDKTALLPGQNASFANYTSYDKGINGIVFDMTNLPGTLSATDFTFMIGGVAGDTNPSKWLIAPPPTAIMTRPGAGVGGSTRVEITWADGAIQNHWLQIVMKKDANTGLAADTPFYFGNAVGESGDSATNAYVTAVDEIGARSSAADLTGQPLATAITNVYDFNRDRQVNPADEAIAGAHYTNVFTAISLLAAPAVPAVELAASPGIFNTVQTIQPPAGAAPTVSTVTTATITPATPPALIPPNTRTSKSKTSVSRPPAPAKLRPLTLHIPLFGKLGFTINLGKRRG